MIIYSIVGSSFQQIDGKAIKGYIVMDGLKPDGDFIANSNGVWVESNQSRLGEIDKLFLSISIESQRPLLSVRVAELQGKEPNLMDIQKLLRLEDEATKLRDERKEIIDLRDSIK